MDKETQEEMDALRANLRKLEGEVNTLRAYICRDNKCPYGMQKDGICIVGIPGCGCMDDVFAWQSSKIDPLVWAISEALDSNQGWRKRAIQAIEPYVPVDSFSPEVIDDRDSIVAWMRNTAEIYKKVASSGGLDPRADQDGIDAVSLLGLASVWTSIADLIDSREDVAVLLNADTDTEADDTEADTEADDTEASDT